MLCGADLSPERPSAVEDDVWTGPTGWGSTHLCKDWVAVEKIMTQHGLPQSALQLGDR